MNDPFGRLPDWDANQPVELKAQIENILWGADSVCWLMVIILSSEKRWLLTAILQGESNSKNLPSNLVQNTGDRKFCKPYAPRSGE